MQLGTEIKEKFALARKKKNGFTWWSDTIIYCFFFLSAWVVTAYLSLQREVFAAFFCSYAVLHTQLFALYSLTEIENVHLRFGFRQDKKAVVFLFLPPCVVFSVVGGSGVVAWAGFTRHVCEAEFRRALC